MKTTYKLRFLLDSAALPALLQTHLLSVLWKHLLPVLDIFIKGPFIAIIAIIAALYAVSICHLQQSRPPQNC
jgi:hypothetical protein